MLVTLLCILKWIGIVLLCLLAIVAAVCLCVLFVPVRYRVRIRAGETWEIGGQVSWFLHLIHISLGTGIQKGVRVRIFGIPCAKRRKKKSDGKKTKQRRKRKNKDGRQPKPTREEKTQAAENAKTAEGNASQAESVKTVEGNASPAESVKTAEGNASRAENAKTASGNASQAETAERKEKTMGDRSVWQTLKKFVGKPAAALKKFFLSMRRLFAKIKSLDDEDMELLRRVFANGGRLLKRLLPRRMRGWLHFGTEDPALTGQILGGLSVLFALTGQSIDVTPDFEAQVLEGECAFVGSLRGIVVLILILRMHPLELMKRYM